MLLTRNLFFRTPASIVTAIESLLLTKLIPLYTQCIINAKNIYVTLGTEQAKDNTNGVILRDIAHHHKYDEVWSFIGHKDNKQWIWLALLDRAMAKL